MSVFVPADTVELVEKGPAQVRELITAEESPNLSFADVVIDRHYPPHYFEKSTQVLRVLSGCGGARVNGEVVRLTHGSVVQIDPGDVHEYWPDEGSEMLCAVANSPAFSSEDVVWTGDYGGPYA